MRQLYIIILSCITLNLSSQTKVVDLVNCLNEQSTTPKEYVLNLFKTSDIVIIGERDHGDTTQYDLLLEIFNDKRFIEDVGHVYTEVGCINRTDWANNVVKADYKNNADFEEKLIELYRELDFNPLWENYNMYKYLKGIYNINKNLEQSKKITIGLTDLAFEWNGMTHKKYKAFENEMNKSFRNRDSIMAYNFMQLYQRQKPINGRKKALLIQSRPHARNMDINYSGIKIKKVGSYIKDVYKHQVKIVTFNWYKWIPPSWELWAPAKKNELTDNGRWDAAFEKTGCKSTGFDLEGTQFGKTLFDYNYDMDIRFQDVFDGIIFYKPFYEFDKVIGIPNVIDKEFSKVFVRRMAMTERNSFDRFWIKALSPIYRKQYSKYYNNVREVNYDFYDFMEKQMNQWITE